MLQNINHLEELNKKILFCYIVLLIGSYKPTVVSYAHFMNNVFWKFLTDLLISLHPLKSSHYGSR